MSERSQWLQLDNAAKIYPAAMRRNWTAMFRVSAELTEAVDPYMLAQAQQRLLKRVPSIAVRLKRGLFWYYMEHIPTQPAVQRDVSNPCVRIDMKHNMGFMFRVRYYDNRIALEIFHALADGSAGLTILKTLVAEYLRIRYGASIPAEQGVLDCADAPKSDEMEDAYRRFARSVSRTRSESNAFYLRGTDLARDDIRITTAMIPSEELLSRARALHVSLTEYLTAVLILAADGLQRGSGVREKRQKPVKVCVPVNLRAFYKTRTLRNFASYINPGIDPRLGAYTLEEVCAIVHHTMGLEATEKNLNAKFTTNILDEKNRFLRITPLAIKNVVMRAIFQMQGDRQSTTSLSNLGVVRLPDEMSRYVTRMDFILGPLWRNRVVFACLTYQGQCYINCTRCIKETMLERAFFTSLVKLGVHVRVESNVHPGEE